MESTEKAKKPRQGSTKRPATLNLDKEVWERLKAIEAESGATPSVTASRILSRALAKEERAS